MLARIILFLVVAMGVYVGTRWWRARRLLGKGGLNLVELNEMMKLAKKSKRIDAGLKMRVLIVEAAGPEERPSIAKRVDAVIRRLAKQEEMAKKISEALEGIDVETLRGKIADLRVDAETDSDIAARRRAEEHIDSLVTQADQFDKLDARRKELHRAAERIMVELKNLHLAMLDAKSSAASLESEPVKHALTELEEAGETLRRETAAEDEVNRMLRVAGRRQRH